MTELQILRVDASLRNLNNPSKPDDIFGRFFKFSDGKGINNASGFRPKSKLGQNTDIESCSFCVLVTTFSEAEWPDSLNRETGIATYFGDKKQPGDIHQTAVGGNRLLKSVFANLHTNNRNAIPPFLLFEKYKGGDGTYMRFLGLAVPGANGMSAFDDLVAVWRIKGDSRFQNYRATFTILKVELICKNWLEDIVTGIPAIESIHCPALWKKWIETGEYTPLICDRKREPRPKSSQLPSKPNEMAILKRIREEFSDREFEFAAAEIVQFMDERFIDINVTQRSRDGGRDAIGQYRVGHDNHQVRLTAFIEAKLWSENTDVGVKPMARLISRIKHRDIGVFVTTSCFSKQVQQELIDDNHPVILISGGDIARILISHEFDLNEKLDSWISSIKALASKSINSG